VAEWLSKWLSRASIWPSRNAADRQPSSSNKSLAMSGLDSQLAGCRWIPTAFQSSTQRCVRANLRFVQTYEGVLDALGHRTRRVIVEVLREGPAAVGDLAARTLVSRPAISQHLKVLQTCRLVDYDTIGTRHLYRLDPAGLQLMRNWLDGFWDEALASFANYATAHAAAEPTNKPSGPKERKRNVRTR
jgi:DNA-binding transcriptional ArsR family regulator